MIKTFMKTAVAGALALGAMTGVAHANATVFPTTSQAGETVGLSAAPLPEGLYFVNTISWGERKNAIGGADVKFLVDVPILLWATPWSVLGGNIAIIGALPMAHLSANTAPATSISGLYNPFAGGAISWDLGGGFSFQYLSGIYFNAGDKQVRTHTTTWRQDFTASYTADGWNLTARGIWGITFASSNGCTGCNGKSSNGVALELTATKTFGKWEVGAVGFGGRSYDEAPGALRQKQFAIGPFVGYNFGPVILQAYLTRDIYSRNPLGGLGVRGRDKETRFWSRIIIPLYNPAPAAPIVTKY